MIAKSSNTNHTTEPSEDHQDVTDRPGAVIDESKDKGEIDGCAGWIELVITIGFYFWKEQTGS